LRDFQPDVEEAFAQTFGDVLGVPLVRGLRRAFDFSRDSVQALAQDTADFLREERRDLVAPAEMKQFLDDVDALRERADRLDARTRQLLQRRQRQGCSMTPLRQLPRLLRIAATWCVTGSTTDRKRASVRPLKWLRPLLPRPRADVAHCRVARVCA